MISQNKHGCKSDTKARLIAEMEKYSTVRKKATNIFEAIESQGHDEDFSDLPATQATGATPGTAEKIEVMRRRVWRGQSPFHPGDAAGSKLGPEPVGHVRYECNGAIREFRLLDWGRR